VAVVGQDLQLGLGTRDHAGWVVVAVTGELDAYRAPMLRCQLRDIIDGGRPWVVVELSDVRFIDAAGLGVLVAALKRARVAGGDLRLVAGPRLARLVELTGLHRVFRVGASLHAVVDALPTMASPAGGAEPVVDGEPG
jgi:anti-sigma B factor antagonist